MFFLSDSKSGRGIFYSLVLLILVPGNLFILYQILFSVNPAVSRESDTLTVQGKELYISYTRQPDYIDFSVTDWRKPQLELTWKMNRKENVLILDNVFYIDWNKDGIPDVRIDTNVDVEDRYRIQLDGEWIFCGKVNMHDKTALDHDGASWRFVERWQQDKTNERKQ